MARVKHIIKRFDFDEPGVRTKLTLGAGTRLDPADRKLKLVGPPYSTAADLFVETWTTTPNALKRWTGFMADIEHVRDNLGDPVTDVRFRLSDGTQEMYWNVGANAWVPAAPNNWNTEAEVSENIAAFPVSNQSIRVVINLNTADDSATPKVSSIRLLAETDLEEMEDYIWRSLLPDMRSKIRPIGEHDIASDGQPTIDLANSFPIETPYNIAGIDAVYNLTTDPRSLSDIFVSYDSVNKIITLDGSPTVGDRLRIRFLYEPEVAVDTSQDYIEVSKVPRVVFEDIQLINRLEAVKSEYIISKATGAGKQVDIAQSDIELFGRVVTDKSKDLARLADQIRKYGRQELLRSVGQDEDYRLLVMDEFDAAGTPSQQESRAGRFRLRIVKAVFYDSDAVDITGVLNFEVVTTRNLQSC